MLALPTLAGPTYRYSVVNLGTSLTTEWPLGRVAPFVGARLAYLILGRQFEDAAFPDQRFAMVSPGLVAGARLQLSRSVHLTTRGRLQYLQYNVDAQRSLGLLGAGRAPHLRAMREHAMRNLAPALLCLLTVACGGDFSNDDLEFQNALPQRQDLAAKLPDAAARSGQGLRSQQVRLQVLGGTSELALQAYAAGTRFNVSVDALLSLLELFRNAPPTTRETDRRIWGPYPDKDHPGHEVRFVMERQGAQFAYLLQYRPKGAGDDAWWTYLPGTFKADGGIRKGEGALALDLKEARARGFDTGDASSLDRLDIGYQTRALPRAWSCSSRARAPRCP